MGQVTSLLTAAEQGPALSSSQLCPHSSLAVPFSKPHTALGGSQPLPQGALHFCCPKNLIEISWTHQDKRVFLKIPGPEYQMLHLRTFQCLLLFSLPLLLENEFCLGFTHLQAMLEVKSERFLVCKARNLWEILGFSPLPSSNNNWYG